MFRDYRAGMIVGYETGGVPICYGESIGFHLKNSRIEFTVSDKMFWPSEPRPGDDEHGVLPDVPLNAELLEPYRSDPDPVLAFTLAYLRNARENPHR